MGFSYEFTEAIRSRFSGEKEVMEALEAGDRHKMGVALLALMPPPAFVLNCLDTGHEESLRVTCEAAKGIPELLKRLLEYEMARGFSVMKKGQAFDAHDVPL